MVLGFLEAFFGSIWLGGKLLSEKSSDVASKNRHENNIAFGQTLENLELEHSLLEEAVKKHHPWVVAQIPEEDLAYIFGEKWQELIDSYYKDTFGVFQTADGFGGSYNFNDVSSILINVLMSQRGYLRASRYWRGYQRGRVIKGVPREDRVVVANRTCRIIERNIRSTHPNIDLYLCQSPFDEYILNWNTDLNSVGEKTTPYFT